MSDDLFFLLSNRIELKKKNITRRCVRYSKYHKLCKCVTAYSILWIKFPNGMWNSLVCFQPHITLIFFVHIHTNRSKLIFLRRLSLILSLHFSASSSSARYQLQMWIYAREPGAHKSLVLAVNDIDRTLGLVRFFVCYPQKPSAAAAAAAANFIFSTQISNVWE